MTNVAKVLKLRGTLIVGAVLAVIVLARPALAQQSAAPENVVGRETCRQCHQAEFAAWEHSSHNTKAWKLLDHPKAAEFAKALGVTDIKGASACTKCHGTQRREAGKLVIAEGNSCESCHGGAGGKNNWLQLHSDFGLGREITKSTKLSDLLLDRGKETPQHRATRDAACKKAGMNRSADAYRIAKNCLQCHLVPNEKLAEAGHPINSKFEFIEWAQGEVRHNFLLDQKQNAEAPTNWTDPLRGEKGRTVESRKRLMFVVGQIADLEVSLRNRANVTSTKRKTLGREACDRIEDIQEELEELDIAELKPVLAAIDGFDKKSLRELTDGDAEIYNAAADAVAEAAKDFVEVHASGDKLPANIKIPKKAKGEAYKR